MVHVSRIENNEKLNRCIQYIRLDRCNYCIIQPCSPRICTFITNVFKFSFLEFLNILNDLIFKNLDFYTILVPRRYCDTKFFFHCETLIFPVNCQSGDFIENIDKSERKLLLVVFELLLMLCTKDNRSIISIIIYSKKD